jgi:DNA-binding transcriptional MerR regulator
MPPLRALADRTWPLDAFVAQANALLPDYLPAEPVNSRVKPEVNVRLVRHHAGEGLLDEPLKEGREARYRYRHLLQLLAVRRLLAAGLSAGAIGDLVRKKGDAELEGLLEGGVTVQVTPTLAAPGQSALAFLASLRDDPAPPPPAAPAPRRRSARRKAPTAEPPHGATLDPSMPMSFEADLDADLEPDLESAPPDAPAAETAWERHTVTDGLELHVRNDFRAPESPKARRNLLTLIEQRLTKRGRR